MHMPVSGWAGSGVVDACHLDVSYTQDDLCILQLWHCGFSSSHLILLRLHVEHPVLVFLWTLRSIWPLLKDPWVGADRLHK